MSITVDDLVSSLRSSHIGQEAIDLARLQVSSINLPFAIGTAVDCVPTPMHPAPALRNLVTLFNTANPTRMCTTRTAV
ncbi:hypothetical protein K474DRAFT_1658854 [Panus rudis PR-1116 ss-1]|nr:hypothetical protein K474DRAFT_1658854 [Panus rudis PR-1116 ss-1]